MSKKNRYWITGTNTEILLITAMIILLLLIIAMKNKNHKNYSYDPACYENAQEVQVKLFDDKIYGENQ